MVIKTIDDLIKELQKYPKELKIYVSNPVQGDCENLREIRISDLYLDDRYPALIIFP